MAYQVKCKNCGMAIDRTIATPHPSKQKTYFCSQNCLEEYTSKNTISDYKKLTDYIQNLYIQLGYQKDDINWGMIGSQLSYLKKTYKYKDGGMLLTLQYYCETLDKKINPIIGVQVPIENFYQKAKEHYIQLQHCEALNEDFTEDKVKVLKSSVINKKKYNKYFIDLNQI